MINLKNWLGLGYYVSEIDQFLINYDNTHKEPSLSQLKEIRYHKNIQTKRNHATLKKSPQSSLIDKLLS